LGHWGCMKLSIVCSSVSVWLLFYCLYSMQRWSSPTSRASLHSPLWCVGSTERPSDNRQGSEQKFKMFLLLRKMSNFWEIIIQVWPQVYLFLNSQNIFFEFLKFAEFWGKTIWPKVHFGGFWEKCKNSEKKKSHFWERIIEVWSKVISFFLWIPRKN